MEVEVITQAAAAITHSLRITHNPHTTNNNIPSRLTTQRRPSKARPNQHLTTATVDLSLLMTLSPRNHRRR